MIDVKKIAEQAEMREVPGGRYRSLGGDNVSASDLEAFASLILEAAAVECERLEDQDFYCDGPNAAYRAAKKVRAMKPGKEQT